MWTIFQVGYEMANKVCTEWDKNLIAKMYNIAKVVRKDHRQGSPYHRHS